MTIREIVTLPDKILRQPARKVAAVTPEVRDLIDSMIETMRAAPGVGLAAPQVAVGQQIIVVEYAEEDEDQPEQPVTPTLYALVNPEIVRHSRTTEFAAEGCLSIPGYMGDVERFESVTIKGLNRQGDPVKIKTQGWLARIFQHEIDHLNGILFIDRAEKVWRLESIEHNPEEASIASSSA